MTLSDKSFRLLNKDTVLVSAKTEKDFIYPDKKGNVVHAAFVTCYARLKLYNELLETLKDRVLYMDTDSAIYFSKEGDFHPPLGDYLGDLTNILDDDKSIIETFCSGGPKNYGYRLVFDKRDICWDDYKSYPFGYK